ncbi:MAG: choice-of-anchor D domain-containing protein [Deltaproteobacteria bacterium]|nr:choice-of-anchor D domain-containing protein [Deltaproteobacteria bacterium]
MTRGLWLSLCLGGALLGLGCGGDKTGTFVVVEVERGALVGDVARIDLEITLGGRTIHKLLAPTSGPLALPTSVGYQLFAADPVGPIQVTGVALDASNTALASASMAGVVARNATTTLTLSFGVIGDGGVDGATLDATVGDDAAVDGGPSQPALTLDRGSYDFGSIVVGQVSEPIGITVTNSGTAAATTVVAALSGAGSGAFVLPDVTSCQGLAPGASCRVAIPFAPTGVQGYTATLTLTADPGQRVATLALAGAGLAPGTLTINPGSVDFGDVARGGNSSTLTFEVSNDGAITTGVLATLLGGSDALQFAITSDGCLGQTLAPAARCTITARFSPGIPGPRLATLVVLGTPGGATVARLSGQGLASGGLGMTPTARDLGRVAAGSMGTAQLFEVVNAGSAPTGMLTTSVSGEHGAEFTLVNDACTGTALDPGLSCGVEVRLDPASAGVKLATLVVAGAPGGSASAALAGEGLRAPELAATPSVVDYGSSITGQSTPTVVRIANLGALPTGITTAGLSGPDVGQFSLTPDGCTGNTIAAGGSCDVTVTFAPTSAGSKAAQLNVSATPGGVLMIALSGAALTPGNLTVTPTAHAFTSVVQGATSTAMDFTVRNTGGSPSGVPSVMITGSAGNQFAVESNGCGAAIPAAGTCVVRVNFTPSTAGPKTATLSVNASPGGAVAATLSGTALAQAALSISPTSFTFPSVVVGSTGATQLYTVRNSGEVASGNLTVALTGDTTSFTKIGDTCGTSPLAAGATCTVSLRFNPLTPAGSKTASLNVSASPGGSAPATATGTGLTPAALAVTPASQSFGSTLNNTSVDRTMTVTNTGQGASSALTLGLGGAAAAQYAIVAPSAGECASGTTTLNGGASCTFRIRFTPTSAGTKAATVTASATTGGASTATLTGDGLTQASLSGTPATLAFSSTALGQTTATMTWTVRNTGSVNTGTPAVSKTGTDQAQFTITQNNCTAALLPSATCTVLVAFAPTTGGDKSATLQITANPGGTQSATLSGTALVPLAVTRAGAGTGTVATVPAGGISCGADCAENYALNTVVVLRATPSNGTSSRFSGWTGACAGFGSARDCSLTMSAAQNVTATFVAQTYNLAFVSSGTYAANLGITGFDAACNTLASSAGINNASTGGNEYVAFVSSATSNVVARLGATARGWGRLDGSGVFDTQTSIFTTQKIFHPIRIDETGNIVTGVGTWTGTASDGTTAAATCTNWTSTSSGVTGTIGRADGGPGHWANDSTSACNVPNHLYCLQKTRTSTVAGSATGKYIWRSNTAWPVSGGIAGANAKCAAEKPAAVTGTPRALLNTTTSGIPVVSTTNYIRPDRILVGTGAELLARTVRTGIWQAADGSYPVGFYVVTGANGLPSNPGTAASTCNNWTNNTASYTLTRGAYIFLNEWWGSRGDPCTVAEPILCFEQ